MFSRSTTDLFHAVYPCFYPVCILQGRHMCTAWGPYIEWSYMCIHRVKYTCAFTGTQKHYDIDTHWCMIVLITRAPLFAVLFCRGGKCAHPTAPIWTTYTCTSTYTSNTYTCINLKLYIYMFESWLLIHRFLSNAYSITTGASSVHTLRPQYRSSRGSNSRKTVHNRQLECVPVIRCLTRQPEGWHSAGML